MPHRLNLFQRLLLQWDRLHPYNAIQAIRFDGPIDFERWRAQWSIALQRLGLGRVRRRGKAYHYEIVGGRSAGEIDRVVTGLSFEAFVNRELNRSFDAGSVPFRPFILSEADRTLVGVVYHHWVADSVSVRLLLRTWFRAGSSDHQR